MIAELSVDFHSHLIPGIDDGAQNLDESIFLIQGLQNLGFSKIIFTPHISLTYDNSRDSILEGFDDLMTNLKGEFNSLEFGVGAEHMLDDRFLSLLKKKEVLPFYKNFILVELGYKQPPLALHQMIFEMRMADLVPVVAHPERYLYFSESFENYYQLKDWGCLFQMNLGSISGYYGGLMLELAHQLIEEKIIDFLASDLHNIRQLKLIEDLAKKGIRDLFSNGKPLLNATLLS